MTRFARTVDSFRPGALGLAGDAYRSETVFATERERIFAHQWICVGRAAELAGPGDYLLADVAGESLLIVRDDAGGLVAHHNVCRHRGTRLCAAERGRLHGGIRCPYHGWTYALDGRLRAAPHMDEVAGFARADFPLHRAAIETAGGFLFVSLADRPPAFEPVAAGFARFERWALPTLQRRRRIDYAVAANWKLVVENYSECYHCPLVHPAFSRLIGYRSGHNDATEGLWLGGYMSLAPDAESLTPSGRRCASPLGTVAGEDLARVYFYALFPNLTISLHPDYAMSFLVTPLAADRTRVRCEWLFAADAAARPEQAVAFWDRTNREDWAVCALVQQGVGSRRYAPSPLSTTESLPAAFHRLLAAAMGPSDAAPRLTPPPTEAPERDDGSRHIVRSSRH